MKLPSDSLEAARKLRAEEKFVALPFYPGAPDEDVRSRCEARVNLFLDDVLGLLARDASAQEILSRAKEMLDSFSHEDTEERERADDYVGELMQLVGVNDWTDLI